MTEKRALDMWRIKNTPQLTRQAIKRFAFDLSVEQGRQVKVAEALTELAKRQGLLK